MKIWPAGIVIGLTLCLGPPLWAGVPGDGQAESRTMPPLVKQIGKKFSRGAANFSLGWLEVPKQIARVRAHSGWVPGLALGSIQGLGMFVARTVAGAYEVLTFPVPLPPQYQPMLEPEFVWDPDEPSSATSAAIGSVLLDRPEIPPDRHASDSLRQP